MDEIRKAYGIRVMGPNCLGGARLAQRVMLLLGIQKGIRHLRPGNVEVSYVIQSGG
jgi:acyl-CoA synthetase (NDP forming)